MRVLHVSSGNMYGGLETCLVTLARYASSCPELQSDFCVCYEGKLKKDLSAAGAAVHRIPSVRASQPWTVIAARAALRKLLRAHAYDAVICHLPWALAVFGPAIRACGVPLVFWMHGAAEGKHWVERWARLSKPDFAIANSRFTASYLPRLFQQLSPAVVYCPVAPIPDLSASDFEHLRREAETAIDSTVIIHASRMEGWKGHIALLEALHSIASDSRWVCWIVGGPQTQAEQEYFQSLQARAANLGIANRIRFLGFRTDTPMLLRAADIYCQPNIAPEPCGIGLVEAMYAQLPIVTSAIGGALEVVSPDCGYLIPSGDTPFLSETLGRLVQDPPLRRRLGMAGPARAAEISSPAGRLKELAAALISVADRSRVASTTPPLEFRTQ
ncbi:MAG TPA: glycosyltransferase family 4 protein [Bryobacteraceae bacterium]|nr:glycosyltransferase family 4 protein [Bryobacteraceae bacterium]